MAFMKGNTNGLYDPTTKHFVGVKQPDGSELVFARSGHYGVFTSNQDQTQQATPEIVEFNATAMSNGISLSGSTKIVVSRAGLYAFHLTLHVHNADSQFQFFDLWGRLNGNNIPSSRFKYSVPSAHGQQDGALTPSQNFFLNLAAGDEVEVAWTCSDADEVSIAKHDAVTGEVPIPAAPSVMLTVSEIV